MLDGIFQVLSAIGDFFSSIIDFVSGLIQGLIDFVTSLASVPSSIQSILGGFPPYLVTGILGLIALMIVLRVVGRD